MKCKNVWVWKVGTCDATFGLYIKSVLHEQHKRCNLCYAERAFLMRCEHQKALAESLMLGHASQTSWVMENLHDKLLHSSSRPRHFYNPYVEIFRHFGQGFLSVRLVSTFKCNLK